MADVPDLGTVIVNEFGRIEKFEGKSYVFKIIQTLPYLGLPTRSKRYWCKEHENIRNADFLKVQWLSEAGGDDGHWAAEHKTIADESITELVLRKEVSYIPAYMLEQIVIVFHVDEELIHNTKGMSDVFVVTRREKKNVKELELLPRGDHVTFTRPLDFLGSPKKIRVLSTMSWTLRLFLRKAIHNVLIGCSRTSRMASPSRCSTRSGGASPRTSSTARARRTACGRRPRMTRTRRSRARARAKRRTRKGSCSRRPPSSSSL